MSSSSEWRSCCFAADKRCIVFLVQTCLGFGLLTFCALRLTYEKDCDRAAPYWGLIGTVTGFFFRKMTVSPPQSRKTEVMVSPTTSESGLDTTTTTV